MMKNERIKDLILNNPNIEISVSIAKGLIAAIPIVGGSITSVFSDWQNSVQYTAIKKVIQKHGEQITKLKEDKLNKEYLNSAEYGYDLLQTIAKAKDEIDESRLVLFSEYISSCCYKENSHCENKRIFLYIINRIELFDLQIMKHSASLFINKDCIEELYRRFGNQSITKETIHIHIEYLVSIGLLKKTNEREYENFIVKIRANPKQMPMEKNSYYLSTLGKSFLHFLKNT